MDSKNKDANLNVYGTRVSLQGDGERTENIKYIIHEFLKELITTV